MEAPRRGRAPSQVEKRIDMDDEAHVRVEVRGELVHEERLGRMHLQVDRRWTVKHVLEHLKAKAKQQEREDLQVRERPLMDENAKTETVKN